MSNVGVMELFLVLVVVVAVFGTPALLLLIFLAVRRANQQDQAAPRGQEPTADWRAAHGRRPRFLAAGHVRADGILVNGSGGVQVERVGVGVYTIDLPEDADVNPNRLVLTATAISMSSPPSAPSAEVSSDEPAIAEALGEDAREQYRPAGHVYPPLVVQIRLANRQPVDRDWTFQIVEMG